MFVAWLLCIFNLKLVSGRRNILSKAKYYVNFIDLLAFFAYNI